MSTNKPGVYVRAGTNVYGIGYGVLDTEVNGPLVYRKPVTMRRD